MGEFAFLSDEWIEKARALREEYAGRTGPVVTSIRMNLVVTAVPFGSGTKDAHLDTSSGELMLEQGHIESPDLTLTLEYDTAKAIVVDQNQQAAMQAFMGGRIKVEGDMSKLLAMQATPSDPVHAEIAERLKAMTA
jgi:hypothetical protein